MINLQTDRQTFRIAKKGQVSYKTPKWKIH